MNKFMNQIFVEHILQCPSVTYPPTPPGPPTKSLSFFPQGSTKIATSPTAQVNFQQ